MKKYSICTDDIKLKDNNDGEKKRVCSGLYGPYIGKKISINLKGYMCLETLKNRFFRNFLYNNTSCQEYFLKVSSQSE